MYSTVRVPYVLCRTVLEYHTSVVVREQRKEPSPSPEQGAVPHRCPATVPRIKESDGCSFICRLRVVTSLPPTGAWYGVIQLGSVKL